MPMLFAKRKLFIAEKPRTGGRAITDEDYTSDVCVWAKKGRENRKERQQ